MRLCKRVCSLVAILAMLFGASTTLWASSWSGSSSVGSDEMPKSKYEPYIYLTTGAQNPAEDAFGQVFATPYFRYGGGFGLKRGPIGAEVMMRFGSDTEGTYVDDTYRVFEITTTELQARIFGEASFKNFRFPVGVGFGLLNVTVDRGYPGIFDRFKGDGFFIGPFVGIQYKVLGSFSLGIDIEYPIGEARFNDNPNWQSQYSQGLEGALNTTETSFWDTVGGIDETRFDNGGLVYSLRMVVALPTFNPKNITE